MRIDENTKGSVANQEATRVLRTWILFLLGANYLICVMVGLARGLSVTHVIWLAFKSFFFSYAVGFFLLTVAIRFFGRLIGVRRVYPVGLLRYYVVLGFVSVVMSLALVYSEPPDLPATQAPELLNSETEQWQAVKDAKAYCAKEGKTMLLQKLDKANRGVTFVCIGVAQTQEGR